MKQFTRVLPFVLLTGCAEVLPEECLNKDNQTIYHNEIEINAPEYYHQDIKSSLEYISRISNPEKLKGIPSITFYDKNRDGCKINDDAKEGYGFITYDYDIYVSSRTDFIDNTYWESKIPLPFEYGYYNIIGGADSLNFVLSHEISHALTDDLGENIAKNLANMLHLSYLLELNDASNQFFQQFLYPSFIDEKISKEDLEEIMWDSFIVYIEEEGTHNGFLDEFISRNIIKENYKDLLDMNNLELSIEEMYKRQRDYDTNILENGELQENTNMQKNN